MDVILDEARKRGMKVWILDDSHFPTGFANGAVKKAPLRLHRQSLCANSVVFCSPAQTEGDPGETARVRHAYMDAVTKLLRESFSRQLGDWCRAHGVQYIGHMIEDGNAHARTGSSLGHYFRGLDGQDMAGIDDIGGQVLPQGEDEPKVSGNMIDARDGEFYHYMMGNLAASAAAIQPGKQGGICQRTERRHPDCAGLSLRFVQSGACRGKSSAHRGGNHAGEILP